MKYHLISSSYSTKKVSQLLQLSSIKYTTLVKYRIIGCSICLSCSQKKSKLWNCNNYRLISLISHTLIIFWRAMQYIQELKVGIRQGIAIVSEEMISGAIHNFQERWGTAMKGNTWLTIFLLREKICFHSRQIIVEILLRAFKIW